MLLEKLGKLLLLFPLCFGIVLGIREAEAGLTYVGCSRMTDIINLFIGQGCSFERLTTAISKNKKLQARLAEDLRQMSLWLATRVFFFPQLVIR